LDITQLQYFVEVNRCCSFTQAAEKCYISAQGMSMSIGRLEDELGVKLFIRTPKGMSLTEDGTYLLPKAEQIVHIFSDVENHFIEKAHGRQSLTVMFIRGTVEKFAYKAISSFKQTHPDIDVKILVRIDSDCDEAVENGDADLALCAGPVNTQKLDATLIYSGKNMLVVNKNHVLANRETICITDLKDVPMTLSQKANRSTSTFFALCNKIGFEPYIFCYTDDYRSAMYNAEINQSCGIVNEVSARKLYKPELKLVPFACSEMDWNIYLIHKKGVKLSPIARDFKEILLNSRKPDKGCQ